MGDPGTSRTTQSRQPPSYAVSLAQLKAGVHVDPESLVESAEAPPNPDWADVNRMPGFYYGFPQG